jgi:hypothetical protein
MRTYLMHWRNLEEFKHQYYCEEAREMFAAPVQA